jgi:hypothetical protein
MRIERSADRAPIFRLAVDFPFGIPLLEFAPLKDVARLDPPTRGASKPKSDSSAALERLRALDPADPGSAAVLMDVVIALERKSSAPRKRRAIYAEIDPHHEGDQ